MSQLLIKLIYSLNSEESSISFDPSNKIAALKNLINLTQNINLDEYTVFYKKREIQWNDQNPIKQIIGRELVPVFLIKKKDELNKQNDQPKINKSQFQVNERNLALQTKNEVKTEDHLKCTVYVDNFPSRAEIFSMVESFIQARNEDKNYKITNTSSRIEIMFKNPDLAFDFLKELNFKKANNPLYSKIKTSLALDLDSKAKIDSIRNTHNLFNTQNRDNSNSYFGKSLDISGISKNSKGRTINNAKSTSQLKDTLEMKQAEHVANVKDVNLRKKLLKNYYKNANFVSLASPYMSDEDKRKLEYREGKRKWVQKKGFNLALPSNKGAFIPNYVNLDVYNVPPVNHKFREDDKKYISKKTFLLA